MWKNNNLPEFGCLAGVKIVHATGSIAGPLGVQLLADQGADVIWLEGAVAPDTMRFTRSYTVESERKNQRNLALNIPTPEGKEILLELIKDADVFVESSKGGQYEKWGLSDDVLWGVNPKLVIVHLSGFGQTGLPEYVKRPSYDAIAQAFSGYVWSNANSVTPPYGVGPYIGDCIFGLYCSISILTALYKVKTSGIGESVDLAQFEALMRTQVWISDWFSAHKKMEQAGEPSRYAANGTFAAKDGQYILFCLVGDGVLKKALPFLGLEYGSELFPKGTGMYLEESEAGKQINAAVNAYLAQKTAAEAQAELLAAGLPVSKINSFEDLEHDPHVKAREVISEWKSFKGTDVRAVGVVPKLKNNPGQVWRPAPYQGMDNEEVLAELGYSAEKIAELYEKKIIAKDAEMKFCMPF